MITSQCTHGAWLIDLRPYQHDNGYIDGRSQIKVHTDERTQVNRAQSSRAVSPRSPIQVLTGLDFT